MAIRVECDMCFESYRVPDDRKGKKIKCKSCGNIMVVGKKSSADDLEPMPDLPPKRRSGGSGKKRQAEPQGGDFPLVPVLGGVGGLVVVGVVVVLLTSGGGGGGNPGNNQAEQVPVAGGGNSPAVQTDSGSPSPAPNNSSPATTIKPENVVWKLTPETRESFEWPAEINESHIFGGSRSSIIYPAIESPFILTGIGSKGLENASVFDITKQENVGTSMNTAEAGDFFLSPDGKTVALIPRSKKNTLLIYADGNTATPKTVVVNEGNIFSSYAAFRSSNELVYIGNGVIDGKSQAEICVINLSSGQVARRILWKTISQPASSFLSPQGRYLIVYTSELSAFDLTTGQFAGTVSLPRSSDGGVLGGGMFSEDGTELWLLRNGASKIQIMVLNVDSGSVKEIMDLPFSSDIYSNPYHKGPALQLMQDGKYILLQGQLLIEKSTKRLVWMLDVLPTEDEYKFVNSAPRFVAGDRVVAFDGPSNGFHFRTYPIKFEEIESLSTAASSDAEALLKPGSGAVAIKMNVGDVRFADKEETRTKLLEETQKSIEQLGFEVANDSKVELEIDYSEAPGHTLQLRPLGIGSSNAPEKTVQVTKYSLKYSVKVNGTPVVIRDLTRDPRSMMFRGDANEKSAREQVFTEVLRSVRGIPLPTYIGLESPTKMLPLIDQLETDGY